MKLAGRALVVFAAVVSLAASSAPALTAPAAIQIPFKQPGSKQSKVSYIVQAFSNKVALARAASRSAAGLSNAVLHSTPGGAIELTFHAKREVGAVEAASLRALDASIQAAVSLPARGGARAGGMIQVRIPYSRVAEAAALPWVAAVTPPDYGVSDTHPTNPINSQGVALHNADDVQTRGINGNGVTVGVISDGVTNLAASQGANELPAVTVNNTGNGDEGTAMLEIVHDMAPGAALMFDAGPGGGVAGHVAAQNWLAANGADVITEDIAFDQEPAFQQGSAASNGDTVAANGVSVHSSAGNQAQRHAARVVANGTGQNPDNAANPFNPAGCPNTPDNVVAIAPGGDTTFDVVLGSDGATPTPNGSTFVLQWSEPRAIFPTAGQGGFTDLNLYVMNQALTQCLGSSVGVQANGAGDTIEVVTVAASLAGTAAKVVVDVQGTSSAVAAPLLDLRWRRTQAGGDATTRAGSLNPDSNYTGQATSSAALNAQGAGALQPYSSGGPVQLITTTQCPGGAAGPCAGVAGTSQTSGGPTWSAADNVSVSGVGGFGSPFTGTSAAAPHAAGCDALLRDETNAPAAAPATTNARLIATAVDIDSPGVDNNTGAGRLDCLLAVNDPPTADAGGPYNGSEGTDVPLNGTGSSDPDTGDSLTYEWDFDNDGSYDDATGATPSFNLVGQDGVYPIGLRVTDTAGATDTGTSSVTVANVAPSVVGLASDGPKAENSAITVSGSITDPGWLEDLTATINWGDGTGTETISGSLENTRPTATLNFSASHTYGDDSGAGTFAATVCGSDDDTTTCQNVALTITNVFPTAVIDENGTFVVNGVSTFIAHAGETVPFDADSFDPGSDDRTTTWDWGDGAPSPDSTELSLNNALFNPDPDPSPTREPRTVSDDEPHAFGLACLYTVTFGASDDDGGSASDTVKVIIAGNALLERNAGYWQTQYRPRPTAFTEQQRQCYLAIVDFMSAVFNDVRNAATVAAAFDVLKVSQKVETANEQLDRQILTAWLNFANGAFDYTELVDTNGNGSVDTQFATVMANAEAARLNPLSTDAQLRAQRDILQRINGK